MANISLRLPARRPGKQAAAASKNYRADVQGLRAVAVGIVLLYHAGMPWMPGGFVGVDVFFVISGFLITGGIVKELRQDGRLNLKQFYIRRMARILPAATATLIATVALTWLLLPPTRWAQVGTDAFASGLYFVNWLFAQSSVDYLAQDQAPSPLQHFWSLAVEEQFYIVWPVLLMLVGWLSLKLNFRLQRGLLTALAAVAIPSFAWSVYYTATNPGGAYFVTTTRMWELAIGAGLAIVASRAAAPPRVVAVVASWAGLAAIFTAAVLYTGALPFPSFTALLPTLGAAAVLWGGKAGGMTGAGFLLNRIPMVKVGELSYSLYLWHWPLLVIVGALIGKLDTTAGLVVVLASFIPAWLSMRYVEKPAQKAILEYDDGTSGEKTKLMFGALFTLVGLVPAALLTVGVTPPPPPTSVEFVEGSIGGKAPDPIGAQILAAGTALEAKDSFSAITPVAVNAADDVPSVNRDGCMLNRANVEAKACSFGDTSSDTVVALVGDSHAAMLTPGFKAMANQAGVRVDTYTKGACPFVSTPTEYEGTPYTECTEWVENVTQKLLAERPDAVVTMMSRYRVFTDGEVLSFEDSKQPLADSLNEQWQRFQREGIPVAAVRSTPRPDVLVPDCVSGNPESLSKCALRRDEILWADSPDMRAAEANTEARVIDLTPALCTDEVCPAVIEGILVYRDNNHLTATYARTLNEQLAEGLAPYLK